MAGCRFYALVISCWIMAGAIWSASEANMPNIKQLDANAWLLTGNYFAEHMTVVETAEGLVVVDTLTTPAASRRALKLVRKFSRKPVRYLINTHFDVDHYGGNQIFPRATIIGHVNCKNHYDNQLFDKKQNVGEINEFIDSLESLVPGNSNDIKKRRQTYRNWYQNLLEGFDDFKFTPPTRFVDKHDTIILGKTTVEIVHLGPGHTDADLVVLFPREKILIFGDLVLGDRTIPVVHWRGNGKVANFITILKKLEKLAAQYQHLVPGHGFLSGVKEITGQRTYLEKLLKEVKEAKTRGFTLIQAQEQIMMEEYKNYWLYEFIHRGNIEAAWHELK